MKSIMIIFSTLFLFAPISTYAARSLYFNLSGNDVVTLQRTLINQGYLAEGYDTGYFGNLTQTAVQKFQCANNIICSGTKAQGYGVYGPQTQARIANVTNYSTNPATLGGDLTPPATGMFEISGWIPYWRSATGTQDVLPHLSQLTSVMPFGYTMKNDGTLADTANLSEEPWISFIAAAKQKGVLVVPSVMWGNGDTTHKILSNTTKRIALEDEIAEVVKENNFDGIDIDFEAKKHETINYFSTFLKGLSQRLNGKLLYCTIEARMPLEHRYLPGANIPPDATDRANDFVEMNKYCDRIEIMAYDQGTIDVKLNRLRKAPYAPVADADWVESLVKLAAQTIDRNKIIIGIPTYGYEYHVTALGNDKYQYKVLWPFNPNYAIDIAKKLGIKPARTSAGELGFTYNPEDFEQIKDDDKPPRRANRDAWKQMEKDESFNFMTWSDAEAIAEKVELARKLGVRGVAVFKFDGGQDPDMWDVLK